MFVKVSILLFFMTVVLEIFVKVSLKMQEIALKSHRKLKIFLGSSIYDSPPPPPLSNTLRGPWFTALYFVTGDTFTLITKAGFWWK